MTSFYILYKYKAILSIKFNISMWQILSWNTVRTCADLIAIKAYQIKKCNEDIKKTAAHLQ